MTNFRMALLDLLRKDEQGADPQFLRMGLLAGAAGFDARPSGAALDFAISCA